MTITRVLVADDNPVSLTFFTNALAQFGITAFGATDGKTALESARTDAFDLLLLDARMPGHSGAEVLALLRAQGGPSRHARALATTADDNEATCASLLGAGFAEVLLKPVSVASLRAALARHLPILDDRHKRDGAEETLDNRGALDVAGGDPAVVLALRGLLARELDELPGELATIHARLDADALRERLHRVDASAGFCGAPSLARAAAVLRSAIATSPWPDHAIEDFLTVCRRIRTELPDY